MEKISKEKLIDIAEHIISAFQKNRTAGYIAFRSLDHLDLDSRAYIMYFVSCYDQRLPEDLRKSLFEETGNLFDYHRKRIEKNLPVKKLIGMFNDKKSGMVGAAARQLKERFPHLDYKDQIKVMDLFLDGSVSYRQWCYRTLSVWREPRYDETLIQHWHKYKDHDCLTTILSTLPLSIAQELYPEYRLSMNRRAQRILLERFGMQPWVEIDRDSIKASSSHVYYFLRSMSQTHLSLSADECAALFYDYLQETFSSASQDELWEINKRFEDENGNIPPLYYRFDEIRLHLTGNSTICVSEFLKLFARMGHYDLVTGMCSWGEFINTLLPSSPQTAECRFLTYIRLLRDNMPTNFHGISATPAYNVDSIANESDFKKMQSMPAMSILTDKLDLVPF